MELKESAYVLIGSFALFLALGYITSSAIFYFSSALLLILIISDYILLRYRLVAAHGNIKVNASLSHRERAPGRQATLEANISNGGRRPLRISLSLLKDDGIETGPMPDTISLPPGGTVKLEVTLTPSICGEPGIGPIVGSVGTMLLKASFQLSRPLAMTVRLPIGRHYLRPDATDRQDRAFAIGNITLEKRRGNDFSGIRFYTPGDNVRNIDWGRTVKYRGIIVREYEQERPMPAIFLLDVSIAGPAPGPGISPGLKAASGIVDRILSDKELLGLVCFSSDDVINSVRPGMGRPHLQRIKKAISGVKPVKTTGSLRPGLLSLNDLYHIGKEYDRAAGRHVLEPIFEETLAAYSAGIRDDGFARAIRKAIEAADGEYSFIVITSLSMGMASLLNGIRLAIYYGHSVTIILVPPGDPDQLEAAASKLKGRSIKAMVLRPGENVESMISEGRVKSPSQAVRGWS